MSATRSVRRARQDVPRPVVGLLWPIYRRSESRSAHDTGSVYILRASAVASGRCCGPAPPAVSAMCA
jgi:hypothetical protein